MSLEHDEAKLNTVYRSKNSLKKLHSDNSYMVEA